MSGAIHRPEGDVREEDWLECESPRKILEYLKLWTASFSLLPSERKLRLFVCAHARQMWDQLDDSRSRQAILTAEQFVDGLVTEKRLKTAYEAAHGAWDSSNDDGNPAGFARYTCMNDIEFAFLTVTRPGLTHAPPLDVSASIFRDIIGNPFRPVVLPLGPLAKCRRCGAMAQWHDALTGNGQCYDCHGKGSVQGPCPWLTPQVLVLAEAAYRDRDDSGTLDALTLAVLADALEEVGCDDEHILMELRGKVRARQKVVIDTPCLCREPPYRHPFSVKCKLCNGTGRKITRTDRIIWADRKVPLYRGFWALDLILGKI